MAGVCARILDALPATLEALDLLARRQAASGQYERAHAGASDRLDLRGAVAQAPILRKHRETLAAAQPQPLDIGDLLVALSIDLVVSAHRPAGGAKRLRDAVAAETAIDEEVRRRLGA